MADLPWLPEDSIYLERSVAPLVKPSRPLWQGDVLVDVPLALTGRGLEGAKARPVTAIMLAHPCSIYAGDRLNEMQLIAAIRPAREAAGKKPLIDPWESHYYLFPLPDLIGGEDFVVDFRRIGMTHYRNLDDRRIACLSLGGWAALQRRWAYHSLRIDLPLSDRIEDLRGLWNEINLWETWAVRGNSPDRFQDWLQEAQSSGPYAGSIRRTLLDYGPDEIVSDMPPSANT
jgi:hypothetical protein